MEKDRIPRQGEIYHHFKDKPYQIVAVATHTETGESLVVYQALYGDFKYYVRPLSMFLSEVDHVKYPEVKQKYRFELSSGEEEVSKHQPIEPSIKQQTIQHQLSEPSRMQQKEPLQSDQSAPPVNGEAEPVKSMNNVPEEKVNQILLQFLDAMSYNKKLEIITSNMKHMNDRLINDMAVSLDCAVEEGPIDKRVQELIYCLKAMSRFEDRRFR